MRKSFLVLFLLLQWMPLTVFAEEVTLVVTSGWERLEFQQVVVLEDGESVLDVLQRVMKVETGFGGSFVTRLNDAPKQQAPDSSWFYYVNGVLANKGAGSFLLQGGEHVWWDYHPWGSGKLVPAVIGAFPQPFIDGAQELESKTVVCVPKSLSMNAEKLVQSIKLQGGANISLELGSCQALEQDEALVILAGKWEFVSKFSKVNELYLSARKTGFSVRFSAEGIPRLAEQNDQEQPSKRASAILAVGGAFVSKPLWVISGASDEAAAQGIDVLVKRPNLVQRKVGLIVDGERLIHVF